MFKYSAQNTSSSLSLLSIEDQGKPKEECLEKGMWGVQHTNACRQIPRHQVPGGGTGKAGSSKVIPALWLFSPSFRLRRYSGDGSPRPAQNPAQGQCSDEKKELLLPSLHGLCPALSSHYSGRRLILPSFSNFLLTRLLDLSVNSSSVSLAPTRLEIDPTVPTERD